MSKKIEGDLKREFQRVESLAAVSQDIGAPKQIYFTEEKFHFSTKLKQRSRPSQSWRCWRLKFENEKLNENFKKPYKGQMVNKKM